MTRIFSNISEAYLSTLKELINSPEYKCSPRGQTIYEITNYSFSVLKPTSETIVTKDEERNKVIAAYFLKEKELYNSGSNLASDFVKASKFWDKLKNPDGTINSAYGFLIWKLKNAGNPFWQMFNIPYLECRETTQWEWAKESLLKDKDSRQAIMHFNLPSHQWSGNKDFTCTMHVSMMIRDDKLDTSIVMRSNDIVKGSAYDWPWFASLGERMVKELAETYSNLSIGKMHFLAHSMHMYDRDLDTVNKMIGK